MTRQRFVVAVAAIIGSLVAASAAVAAPDATWPERPIRIVVAQAPAGPPDLVARFVAEPLGRALGTPVVIDNRPGAGGIIGVDAVSRAVPDGYTLLIATLSTHALVPHVAAKVPYDPVRGFVPVANLFRSVKVLWVSAALPVKTLPEFVAYASARPGTLNFASGGVGSSNHVDPIAIASTAILVNSLVLFTAENLYVQLQV
jgi:tripartite-type tricarboxylate transporter receptor subunit TctC